MSSDIIPPTPARRAFMLVSGLTGLTGLLLQAHVTSHLASSRGWTIGGAIVKYLSYFTITTNILLALGFLAGSLAPRSRAGAFANRPSTATALLVYIAIVGIVYVLVLAGLWKPQGLQWWADVLLHYATPVLCTLHWIAFVPKIRLPWTAPVKWLCYPALYLLWAMIYGSHSGHYPYPFIDLDRLGSGWVLANGLGMTAAFLTTGLLLTAISRKLARER
ncbi:Pr6Pr family membrane protein [Luteolibacter ambystomatis]|uniref:Pr6Pr family membrane protein n=1 Tax=Luteolibacter ambystomatis TaxID=2824561 RepID=A0A975PG41_9BACT|nr:Pr6Pr family membrane protein [Luteolibacter ambystomatis]QUE51971.1 Pr6Pr family membrane protein [Luteolibacter ambystomatis]